MGLTSDFKEPSPIIDSKETITLDNLTKRYNKLIEPSMIAKLGTKAGQLVPEKVKQIGSDIGLSITEKELMEIFCENRQNLVKQRITPHFLTTDHPNYYEFTTKG